MKTRLTEVAAFAGVSTATVGRVLNGRPGIAPRTRDAVLTALDVFGFDRPRALRRDTAPLVGLVVPDLGNPIFPAFVEAVSPRLVKLGLMPVLCTRTADTISEAHYIRLLLQHDVAGIVFVGSSYADAGTEYGRELRERSTPLVLINAADDGYPGAARVSADDAAAVRQALVHLTAFGHEHIGIILGPVGHVPSARKLAEFAVDRDRAGAARWRDLVEHAPFSMEGGAAAAARLIAAGVSAVVAASDALALGAVRAARRAGLSVPADLSVVGFDDSMYLTVTDPPLTTLRQPVAAMSAAAVSLLEAQINGNAIARPETRFEPELILRGSTAPRSR